MRDKFSRVEILIKKLSKSLNIKQIVVTRGRNGSIHFSGKKNKFIYCPAFASKVVDKVGAGDAMLSIMSILISEGLDVEMSMFFGALAAAQNVETISNSKIINKTKLLKYAMHMLQ
jgi:sugar/nucleoside kinase (ribokinase family)